VPGMNPRPTARRGPGLKPIELTGILRESEASRSLRQSKGGGIGLNANAVGVEEAAEKGLASGEKPGRHTSGAEARAYLIGFVLGMNPQPTARFSFSAACETPTYPSRIRSFYFLWMGLCRGCIRSLPRGESRG